MQTFQGLAVSGGVGIGKAKIILPQKIVVESSKIEKHQVESEIARFEQSLQHVLADIDRMIENYSHTKDNKKILTTHKMMLKDPEFIEKIKQKISEEFYSLEKAVDQHFNEVIEFFAKMDNNYMSERSQDFQDVAQRLLSHITNQKYDILDDVDEDSILLLQEITPSQITKLFEHKVNGLITEKGSKTDHSSIIARSIGLPTIVSLENITQKIENESLLILDGYSGKLIVEPEADVLEKYQKIFRQDQRQQEELRKIIDKPALTRDGRKISLKCNIEIPEEMSQVKRLNCDGIGLLRTEFIFIDRPDLPDEEEQFAIYKKIAEKLGDKELIIRTIDVGGDKLSKILSVQKEINPNLGCRGIRISLAYPEIFKVQLKAILRANKYGNISLMFPMVSSLRELRLAKKILAECQLELSEAAVEFDAEMRLGVMIEVPSAALNSELFAAECDFLSIGTNDLIQYTLAVDRGNEHVIDYYQPLDPAVLKLISTTVQSAKAHDIPVSICGEMASELDYVPLLIGLGVTELSVSPGTFLKVKDKVLQTNYSEAKKIASQALQAAGAEEVQKIIFS
ncbi:MAG: phosphoenolpyruvate--protein phosphotransferase [Candidatus Cloacimonadales bacterium]